MTGWAADFSSAQLSIVQLRAGGFGAALRYIEGEDKQISTAEFHNLTTTPGFALALVQESYAQAAQGGYSVGRAEALAAFARADQLGWPATRPIYFVCEDPNWLKQPSWAAIEGYLRGVASVVPVSRIGDYGSAAQIDHMLDLGLCTFGWAVETWPGDHSRCALVQIYNHQPGYPLNMGGLVDPNMILAADWGQWSATAPIPAPVAVRALRPGQEARMIVIPHPTTARRDYLWPDSTWKLWHSWTDDKGGVGAGSGVEDLAGFGYTVAAAWTAAGGFVVVCDGVDGHGYEKVSDGTRWVTSWTPLPGVFPHPPAVGAPGTAGKPGLAGHDGLAGPQGLPGAAGGAYDDAQAVTAVADALRPPKTS